MSRPIVLTLLVIASVGGLAAFLHWGSEPAGRGPRTAGVPLGPIPPVAPPIEAGPDTAPEGRGAAELMGPERTASGEAVADAPRTTVVFPLQVELSLSSRSLLPRSEDVMTFRAGAVAGIEGTVNGRDGGPAVGATVEFVAGPNVGRVLMTDARGRFGATDLWQGLSIVLVKDGALTSERPVRLGRLARTPFAVDFSATVYVGATIQDAAARPIEGAEVRIDGTVYYTNADGQVTFPNVTVGKVLTSVRKPGYARIERELSLSRNFVEPKDNVYTLRRGASLAVHVQHPGLSTVPALLYLMPAGGSGGPGGTTLRDFPWHAVSPIEIPPGRTVKVDDLPEDVIELRLFHPGSKAQPATRHQRLSTSQVTEVELQLTSAPALIGKVLRNGQPASGVRVSLEAPDADFVTTTSLDKKPMYAQEIVLPHVPIANQTTLTDSRGAFMLTAFEGLDTGRYLIATTTDGRWRAARLVRAAGADLVLELQELPEKGGALEFDLPGRFQGLPVEVRVNGRPLDPQVLRPGEPLLVEDLEYGTWRVYAMWEHTDVVPRQAVDIGADTVRVTGVLPEPALRGQTEDVRRRVLGQ